MKRYLWALAALVGIGVASVAVPMVAFSTTSPAVSFIERLADDTVLVAVSWTPTSSTSEYLLGYEVVEEEGGTAWWSVDREVSAPVTVDTLAVPLMEVSGILRVCLRSQNQRSGPFARVIVTPPACSMASIPPGLAAPGMPDPPIIDILPPVDSMTLGAAHFDMEVGESMEVWAYGWVEGRPHLCVLVAGVMGLLEVEAADPAGPTWRIGGSWYPRDTCQPQFVSTNPEVVEITAQGELQELPWFPTTSSVAPLPHLRGD